MNENTKLGIAVIIAAVIVVFVVTIRGTTWASHIPDILDTPEPIILKKTWVGSSDKTTDTFYVPTKQVRISWDVSTTKDHGMILISITNPQRTYYEYWTDLQNDPHGETYAYLSPGNYYLEIQPIHVKYTITIESVTK